MRLIDSILSIHHNFELYIVRNLCSFMLDSSFAEFNYGWHEFGDIVIYEQEDA